MKNANLLIALGSAVFFTGTVHAQTAGGSNSASQPKPPLTQAAESVGKNLARDPDNRGLQNASQRIADNIADRQARMDARDAPTSFDRPMFDRPGRGR